MNWPIFTIIISLLVSCRENSYTRYTEGLKQNIGASELTINEVKDTILIDIYYSTPPSMGYDFKSSSTALMFMDTAKSLIKEKSIHHVNVYIHANKEVTEYKYPLADLTIYKSGMDVTTLFIQNLLHGQAEQNARYVDLDKISLEELFNLNEVNEQMQSNLKINLVSYDGFSLHNSEPNVVEYRGNFQGEEETIPFVFHYDKNLKRIFYFGINE